VISFPIGGFGSRGGEMILAAAASRGQSPAEKRTAEVFGYGRTDDLAHWRGDGSE